MAQFIAYSIGVFLTVIILLVIILLVAKKYLSPSGNVNITVNGDKVLRPAVDNVKCRCSKGEGRSSTPRSPTSPVSRSRTTGVLVVSAR